MGNNTNPFLLFLLVFLVLLHYHVHAAATESSRHLVPIRLADGVDRSTSTTLPQHPSSAMATPPPASPSPRRNASPPYGPRLLQGLAGQVWTVTENGYEYKLRLFQNVTQRKTTDSLVNVLGVWDRWEVVEVPAAPAATASGGKEEEEKQEAQTSPSFHFRMYYTDGDVCVANITRSVVVEFRPDDGLREEEDKHDVDFRLSDAKEPHTCSYTLTLHSPIPAAVFQKELAAFTTHPKSSYSMEEEGETKRGKIKKGKRGLPQQVVVAVGRVLGGMLHKAWKAVVRKIKKKEKVVDGSSSSSLCACAGVKEEKVDALVSEVGEMRTQLSAFLEEMRGGGKKEEKEKEKEAGSKMEEAAGTAT